MQRAGDEADLVFRAELEALATARGIRLLHLVGRRAPGSWLPTHLSQHGDAAALLRVAPDIADQDLYVCGPEGWMRTVQDALAGAGVPAEQVHVEHFTW